MANNFFVTQEDIEDLLGRRSDTGILSICLDGGRTTGSSSGWQISHLRSGLRQLVHSRSGDSGLESTADATFDEISGFSPEIRGRSLVYFRDFVGDFVWWRSLQRPISTHFTWMDAPFLRPLVAYLDDSPNVGVVVVSQDIARLMTWRQGMIETSSETEIKPSSQALRAGGAPERNPKRGPHATSPADRLRNRVSDRMRRFAGEVAGALPREAVGEAWEKIVIVGPSPLREVLQAHLGQPWRNIVIGSEDKVMTRSTPGEISQSVEQILDRWNRERERRELFETIDIANSGGKAITGADGCLKLLQEGRVSHLYFASDLTLRGLRKEDGSLTTMTDIEGLEGTEEPYLVERMVELALETGADVTPVESEVVIELKDLGGVAARLRY